MGDLFAGKRVLITGTTHGIGKAAAERFREEVATVIMHDRTRESIAGLAEAAGDLDVLVNCAGIYEGRRISEVDEDQWDRIIEANVTLPFLSSRALIDGLTRRAGVIVNVSSEWGLLGRAGSSVYCASMGALIGLTRAIATELAPHVRALCVCPGPVEDGNSSAFLGRGARAEEIAEAILFAASPRCSFQTGSVIVVDGGITGGKGV